MRIVIIVVIVALLIGSALFLWARASFSNSLQARIDAVESSKPVELAELDHLPPLIRAYLERAGLDQGKTYRYVQTEQTGDMKLAEDGEWQPFTAEQWFSVARPAFVWKPSMPMPVGSIIGSDWLDGDQGGLEMRLFGAIPVANAQGVEVAEGELARYLAELPWNPAAMAANEHIEWTQDDDRHATATLTVGKLTAGELTSEMTYEFDDQGEIISVVGERPRGEGDDLERLPWGGEFLEYGEFDGVRVPTRAEVFWELPSGRFTYWRGEITGFKSF